MSHTRDLPLSNDSAAKEHRFSAAHFVESEEHQICAVFEHTERRTLATHDLTGSPCSTHAPFGTAIIYGHLTESSFRRPLTTQPNLPANRLLSLPPKRGSFLLHPSLIE